MKLRKWTALVALALALLTACGDDNPGGDSGSDGGRHRNQQRVQLGTNRQSEPQPKAFL